MSNKNGKITKELITQLEAGLSHPLQTAGVSITALFHLNNELVLVVDDGDVRADAQIIAAIRDHATPNGTPLRVVRCSKGTGCIDLKTTDNKPIQPTASEESSEQLGNQVATCLQALLQTAEVAITGLFHINNELVLVVDDGDRRGSLDTQILAAIDGCPALSDKPLRVVRCSKGTGCIDIKVPQMLLTSVLSL
jgi:hypothetical protein